MTPQRLFVASCMSIGTAAMAFAIRGDVAGRMSAAFHLINEQVGMVFSCSTSINCERMKVRGSPVAFMRVI